MILLRRALGVAIVAVLALNLLTSMSGFRAYTAMALGIQENNTSNLNVTVKWRDGVPFEGAYVEIGNETWFSSHYTDVNGTCIFEQMDKGSYTIWTDPATNGTRFQPDISGPGWDSPGIAYYTSIEVSDQENNLNLCLSENLTVLEKYREYPQFLRICIDLFARAGYLGNDPRYYNAMLEGSRGFRRTRSSGGGSLGYRDRSVAQRITIAPLDYENFGEELLWIELMFQMYMNYTHLHDLRHDVLSWWAQKRTGEMNIRSFSPTFFESTITPLALNILHNSSNPTEQVEKIVRWVIENIEYGGCITDTLEEILNARSGTCDHRATMIVALTKAAGIPSREVTGYGPSGWSHAWVECYLNRTWIAYDTTGALHSPCWEPISVSDLDFYNNFHPIWFARTWLEANGTDYTIDRTHAYNINGTQNLIDSLRIENSRPEADELLDAGQKHIDEWKQVAYDTDVRIEHAKAALSHATAVWMMQNSITVGAENIKMINVWEYATAHVYRGQFRPTFTEVGQLTANPVCLYATVVQRPLSLTFYPDLELGDWKDCGAFPWPTEKGFVFRGEVSLGYWSEYPSFPLYRLLEEIHHLKQSDANVVVFANFLCYDYERTSFHSIMLDSGEIGDLCERLSALRMVQTFVYRTGTSAIEESANLFMNWIETLLLANQSSSTVYMALPPSIRGYEYWFEGGGVKCGAAAEFWDLCFYLVLSIPLDEVQLELYISTQCPSRYRFDNLRFIGPNGETLVQPPYVDCPANRYLESSTNVYVSKQGTLLDIRSEPSPGSYLYLRLSVEFSTSVVCVGDNVEVWVSAHNSHYAAIAMSFYVRLYLNSTLVGTFMWSHYLAPAEKYTIMFTCNLDDVTPGNYTVGARALLAPGENDAAYLLFGDGTVTVKLLMGDLNNDNTANILDITIVAVAYGSKPGDPKWNEIADIDENRIVNILDITMVAKDYGKTV